MERNTDSRLAAMDRRISNLERQLADERRRLSDERLARARERYEQGISDAFRSVYAAQRRTLLLTNVLAGTAIVAIALALR